MLSESEASVFRATQKKQILRLRLRMTADKVSAITPDKKQFQMRYEAYEGSLLFFIAEPSVSS